MPRVALRINLHPSSLSTPTFPNDNHNVIVITNLLLKLNAQPFIGKQVFKAKPLT